MELTYNWGRSQHHLGDAFGHVALGVRDIYATREELAARGGHVVRPAGPMNHGSTLIAFVKDPNGSMIELVQR